jgi:hypothetical protein
VVGKYVLVLVRGIVVEVDIVGFGFDIVVEEEGETD